MVPCYFGASFSPCGAQVVPFPGRPTWIQEFPGCSRCRLTAKARHMCRPGTAPVPSTVPLSKWDFARSVPGKFPFLCVMWVRHLCHILQSSCSQLSTANGQDRQQKWYTYIYIFMKYINIYIGGGPRGRPPENGSENFWKWPTGQGNNWKGVKF